MLGLKRWGATDVFLEEGMLKPLGPVSCYDPVRVVAKAVTGTSDLLYSWVLGVKSLLSSRLGPIHSRDTFFSFPSEFSCLRSEGCACLRGS